MLSQDTVVRWSAAKGLGRVTSRLTSTLSEEVLSSILELFSPGEVLAYALFLETASPRPSPLAKKQNYIEVLLEFLVGMC